MSKFSWICQFKKNLKESHYLASPIVMIFILRHDYEFFELKSRKSTPLNHVSAIMVYVDLSNTKLLVKLFVSLLLLQIVEICSNHLSVYQLTVEQGTALSKDVKLGKIVSLIFFLYIRSSVSFRIFNKVGNSSFVKL